MVSVLRRSMTVLAAVAAATLALTGCDNPAGDGGAGSGSDSGPSGGDGGGTQILPAPSVDPGGGTFEFAPTVTVTGGEGTTSIRYTLDGSDPDPDSTLYERPIQIPVSRDPVELRTRAFDKDDEAGGVSSESYSVERGPTLTIETAGAGTVATDPDAAAYRWDETVSLRATPAAGYTFDGWSGNVATDTPNIDITMDDHHTVTATFVQAGPAAAHALRGGIVVNEILPDPSGTDSSGDTDGNGTVEDEDEYIELYNAGDTAVDLAGLVVWDAGYGDWFTFPAESVVEPESYALVVGGLQEGGALPTVPAGSIALQAERGRSVLNNSSDNVVLLDPEANRYVQLRYNGDDADDPTSAYDGFPPDAAIVDDVEDWGDDVDGVSLARRPDGTGEPMIHTQNGAAAGSPGTANPSGIAEAGP